MQRHFGVTVRSELMAERFELFTNFLVIVDLAIKGNNGGSIGRLHWLVATAKVNDLQTHRAY